MDETTKPEVVTSRSGEARKGHSDEHKAAVGEVGENGQHPDYWVISDEDRAKGHVRPVRRSYIHTKEDCGALTTMSLAIAETYAKDPKFYSATFCVGCKAHFPVGEFVWDDAEGVVGS